MIQRPIYSEERETQDSYLFHVRDTQIVEEHFIMLSNCVHLKHVIKSHEGEGAGGEARQGIGRRRREQGYGSMLRRQSTVIMDQK